MGQDLLLLEADQHAERERAGHTLACINLL